MHTTDRLSNICNTAEKVKMGDSCGSHSTYRNISDLTSSAISTAAAAFLSPKILNPSYGGRSNYERERMR